MSRKKSLKRSKLSKQEGKEQSTAKSIMGFMLRGRRKSTIGTIDHSMAFASLLLSYFFSSLLGSFYWRKASSFTSDILLSLAMAAL